MKKNNKKILLIIGIILVVALVLVNCGGNTSYEDTVDALTEAFNNNDVEAIEALVLEPKGGEDMTLEELFAENAELLGEYEYSFTISEDEPLNIGEIWEYNSEYKKGYNISVHMDATPKNGGEVVTWNSFVSVVLYDGEWYFWTDSEIYNFADSVIPLQ